MKIVRIDPKKPDPRHIREAVLVLKRGGLVVYPTETAYALGCDAKNARAMKRIYGVKGREPKKLLPVIAASMEMAERIGHMTLDARVLACMYWPGPLTLVLGKVAVRVSPHPVAHALALAFGRPIVSTSANRSGEPTKYDVVGILGDLGTTPDLVLDAGTLKPNPPSTIVRCTEKGNEVLRQGAIKL